MTAQQRPMTAYEWSLLGLLSLLWGGSFFFVGVAVHALPPLTIVAVRVGVAATLLWATAGVTGLSARKVWQNRGALALLALINNVLPFVLIVFGQTRIASGVAAILNASTPVITVLAAHLLTQDERLTPTRIAGALLGLGGVAAMIGPDLRGDGQLLAECAVLGAAVCYAVGSIYGRRFRGIGLNPIDIATGQVTAAFLILAPLALAVDAPWRLPAPGLPAIASLLAIGSASTALAYVVYFRILAGAGATNVVLVTLLAPVTSVLLGTLALGEALSPRNVYGFGLIAAGLALIDGRPLGVLRGQIRRFS
jgi:drug/metabolite transporter (DMT)-like permease